MSQPADWQTVRDARTGEPLTMPDVAKHEAKHAAAALLQGLTVTEASADLPTPDSAGHVIIKDWSDASSGSADELLRKRMIVSMAGNLGHATWPPAWPLNTDAKSTDEQRLAIRAEQLALDEPGYDRLVRDTYLLAMDPTFTALAKRITVLLENGLTLGERELRDLHDWALREAKGTLEHKFLDVTDVEADQGTMVALASTWQTDLVKDRVMPGAYAEAVSKIKAGERLPLIWQHDLNSPLNFVGEVVDADETSQGLRIRARFDLDDDAGRKAYQLVKRGTIKALSIGYRILEKRRAAGGITELLKIELHEVSLVLSPANPGARILSIKDAGLDVVDLNDEQRRQIEADREQRRKADRELRRKCDDFALQAALGWRTPAKSVPRDTEADKAALRALRQRSAHIELELAVGGPVDWHTPSKSREDDDNFQAFKNSVRDDMLRRLGDAA